MKSVFLLGDLVRYSTDSGAGYGFFVMDGLEGEAYVYSPKEDCRSAENTLRHLHEWAARLPIEPEKIDLVHWNNGLWDVARILGDEPITPIDAYAKQLVRIHGRIRRLFPNAQIIFAATTPVIEAQKSDVMYRNADIEAYNRAAAEALIPLGVRINDLYAAAKGFGIADYRTGEYFSVEGARKLGEAVVRAVRTCLKETEQG